MSDRPGGQSIQCPECGYQAIAVIPQDSEIVDHEDDADGKVWTNCQECEAQFLVYYRADDSDDDSTGTKQT